jgi:arylsulfatase A-like enzyme
MFTGHYASQQSGDHLSPMDGHLRTLAEVLRDHGYATAGFVANRQYAAHASGLHRGFAHYDDTRRTWGEILLSTTITQSQSVIGAFEMLRRERWMGGAVRRLMRLDGRTFGGQFPWPHRRDGREITDGFLRWQANVQRPYFAFLNYMEVHDALEAPTRNRFNGGATPVDRSDGALYSLDLELRRLVTALDSLGTLARTVIIVTSDHGELINEHGLNGHSTSLYLNVLRVPLVIIAPNSATTTRVSRVVSLRDLPATVLSLATIASGALPGTPLFPVERIARGDLTPSPAIAEASMLRSAPTDPTHFGDVIGVVDDSLHVIRSGTGEYQVFAYRVDTAEVNDLTRDPRMEAWARALIDSLLDEFQLRAPNAAPAAQHDTARLF